MGKNNREVELKLRVDGANYEESLRALETCVNYKYSKNGRSKDLYWRAFNKKTADFVRLRFHSSNWGEVTVKHQDRKTTLNRVEIDLSVLNPTQARLLLERLLGPAVGQIEKKYCVLSFSDNNNVSIYHIPEHNATFIEIEMTTKRAVDRVYKKLAKSFPFKLTKINSSLFSLYVDV